tara:strand:- start:18359 stop:18532 length:174 start_codon:yes stop_codon:yes gene_type:complete
MMGYDMKDGREINNARTPEMGITKLVNMKREMKRYKKVQMIAEGNEMANANIDLFKR